MEGFVQFAQKTVKAVSEIIPFSISVSNDEGYIIGDTDSSRIGTMHSPSVEVIEENKVIRFTEEKAASMENVLPGVAVPLNFDNKPVGVLGIIGDPDEVESYANLVKRYVEMMWQETFHVQLENLNAMTLESFVQYVLLNESVNQEQVDHYCRLLRIEQDCMRLCIVTDIGNHLLKQMDTSQKIPSSESLKQTLLKCVVRAYDGSRDSVCAFLNAQQIVYLKPLKNEGTYRHFMGEFRNRGHRLQEMLQVYGIDDVTIAAGNCCTSLECVFQSYREAALLMQYGRKQSITPGIYNYYDWDVLMDMLPHHIDANLKKILLKRLKPLINDESFPQLKHDFLTYCSCNMNVSRTAEALFVHRNTLIYRLKKINAATGLDTGSFEHCTLLYFVLKE
ncbi:CdaR family transcriptional regulator [Virgibacillus ihumii]|uniref:CdaR family transcriptional regulator n=1 Tax=Virgibacillus ihumii TaxID=2686091 RepID=UPI00157D898C|nr:sugar diacid recognition domain-containing protein [Virgibacillus ihumii]